MVSLFQPLHTILACQALEENKKSRVCPLIRCESVSSSDYHVEGLLTQARVTRDFVLDLGLRGTA